ncbi:MAG: iron-sulfur binding hydrogenase [Candidatus Thermoplasmatota archaeon]|jgi:serine kinase of HPr protein (carbohydrate metabolism regulator)|nr:iron-sulfur binding hydrogenase [Candidatus Thermoplasmatota archaeon]
MELAEIKEKLDLVNINAKPIKEDITVSHGYACDLLSVVLAKAKPNTIWLTIQSHMNIIGVASMANIPAVVICDGYNVAYNVIEKADEENIALFKSQENAFQLSGKLAECGIE